MIYLNGSYFISINFEFKEILDKTRLRIKGKNSVIDIRIVQKFGSKRQSGITMYDLNYVYVILTCIVLHLYLPYQLHIILIIDKQKTIKEKRMS